MMTNPPNHTFFRVKQHDTLNTHTTCVMGLMGYGFIFMKIQVIRSEQRIRYTEYTQNLCHIYEDSSHS